jgi:hypothetical protein
MIPFFPGPSGLVRLILMDGRNHVKNYLENLGGGLEEGGEEDFVKSLRDGLS